MGGLCTTTTEQLPTSTEVVTGTNIPAFVAEGGKRIFEQAEELAQSDFPEYTGERFATYGTDEEGNPERLTELERQGLDILANNTDFQDILQDSVDMAGTLGQGLDEMDPFSADTVNQYMGTFQTAIDPALDRLQREREDRQVENRADAIRAGAFGGSRLGVREALTDAEFGKASTDLVKQAGLDALTFASDRYDADRDARRADFETDEASRLRATETLSQLAPLSQALTEQRATGLLTAGEAERTLDQRALDTAYGDFLQQQQFPFEMLNFVLGALQGIPYETLTRQLSTGSQIVNQPSIYGQTVGALGALGALYGLVKK